MKRTIKVEETTESRQEFVIGDYVVGDDGTVYLVISCGRLAVITAKTATPLPGTTRGAYQWSPDRFKLFKGTITITQED